MNTIFARVARAQIHKKRYASRVAFAAFAAFFVIGSIFSFNSSLVYAATYNFVQSGWAGGTDGGAVANTSNITNWAKYSSQSGLTVGSTVSIPNTPYTFTDDGATSTSPSATTLGGGFANGTTVVAPTQYSFTDDGTVTAQGGATGGGFGSGANSSTAITGNGTGASVALTGTVIANGPPATYTVGSSPQGVAFDSSTNSVWVANAGGNTVTKLNTSTGALVGTYSVGTSPFAVACDSSTNSVWVANYGSNNVTKLNASTGALIGTYTVGTSPLSVAFDSSTNSVWVANYGSNNVTKLNASTGALVGTYATGAAPFGVTFDSSTNSVWVANFTDGTVTKLTASTGALVGTYAAGTNPVGVAFDSSTNSVWVANHGSNNVTKLTASTGALVGTYAAGSAPYSITFDSSTNSVWVANYTSNDTTKLTASTGALVGTYAVGTHPESITFDSSTNSVWVANTSDGTVTKLAASSPVTYSTGSGSGPYGAQAYDPSTNSVWTGDILYGAVIKSNASTGAVVGSYLTGTINTYGIAYDSSTNSVWVSDTISNTIKKLNPSTGAVLGSYNTGTYPEGVAFDSSTNSIWVANNSSNNVTKIRASDGTVLGTYAVAGNPSGVAFDSSTNSIWVIGQNSTTITKLNSSTGGVAGAYTITGNDTGVAFDSSTNSVWVTNAGGNTVTKLNTSTGALVGTYNVGSAPQAVAFDSATNSIWTANYTANTVSKINSATGALVGTYAVGTHPYTIAFDSTNNAIWIGNYGSANITKIVVRSMSYLSSPGTFTSAAINLGSASTFSTLTYTKTTPTNTAVTVDVRAGDNGSTWGSWLTGVASGGDISSLGSHQYVQYRANLSTTDTTVTPTLDSLTINYANGGGSVANNVTGSGAGSSVNLSLGGDPGTGGTATSFGGKYIHTFTTTGTTNFTLNSPKDVQYLVVAGGGGAGTSNGYGDGGGGAGGLLTGTLTGLSANTYPITVGAGGGKSINGVSSTFSTITATGGGGGGTGNYGSGGSGGSGAGGNGDGNPVGGSGGSGVAGQGYGGGHGNAPYNGGGGGGGGGAGAAATSGGAGAGGAGVASSISGSSVTYAAGGNGVYGSGSGGASGANTGNGGSNGGTGGSGIVILSYSPNYVASGTFTSAVINLSGAASLSTLTYAKTTPANTSLTMDIRAGNTATPDGTWTAWTTNVTSGASISALGSKQYVQYRANLSTTDTSVTPTLDSVSIGYSQYGSGNLISSVYDTGDTANVIAAMAWAAIGTTTTEGIKFQVRTGTGTATTSWCGWADCSGNTYFTDANNGAALPGGHPLLSGNNRFFQYQAFFTSGGAATPVLTSATVQYVVNAPPVFDGTYGTNGVIVSQNAATNPTAPGAIAISYRVKDSDTTTSTITPSFRYSLDNGATWSATSTALTMAGGDTSAKTLDSTNSYANYNTYTATWFATSSIPDTYSANVKIQVVADDGQAANRYGFATSAAFAVDTKVPVVTTGPLDASYSATTASTTFSGSDDSQLQYRYCNEPTFSGGSCGWSTLAASPVVATVHPTLVADSQGNESLYIQAKDAYGDLSAVKTITAPAKPANFAYVDVSNTSIGYYAELVNWTATSSPTFGSYKLYKSTNGFSYTLLKTITDPAQNYYLDAMSATSNTQYYKAVIVDASGNISTFTSILSDVPDGYGGQTGSAPDTAPVITNLAASTPAANTGLITFTTDKIATSTVLYGTAYSSNCAYGSSVTTSAFTTSQSITLTGLTTGTQYYFCVKAGDIAGSVSTLATGTTVGTYTVGTSPDAVAFDSSTNSVWVVNNGSNNVTKLSAATGATVGTYTVGTSPDAVAFDSSTNSVWVANSGSNNVTKLSAATGTTVGTYTVGTSPDAVAFDSSTNSVWVANSGSNNVTKLSAATGAVVNTYAVGTYPTGIAFDSLTNSVWVVNHNSSNITKLSAATGAVVGTYTSGTYSYAATFDSSTNSVWVTNDIAYSATKIDAATGAVVGTYSVGASPYSIAFDSFSNSIWVVNNVSSNVTKLNAATGAVIGTYTAGTYPTGIAFDSSTNSIWIASSGTNNIIKRNAATFLTFTTTSANALASVITSNVNSSAFTVSWNTSTSSDSYVSYATTTASGVLVNPVTIGSATLIASTTAHQVNVTGLTSGTTYHFSVKSTDGSGNTTTDDNGGAFYTAITTIIAAPVISFTNNIATSTVTANAATIVFNTDKLATSTVQYGTTLGTCSSYTGSVSTSAFATAQSISLTSLNSSTTYYFCVKATDTTGVMSTATSTTANGTPLAFTTTSGPHITNVLGSIVDTSTYTVTWDTATSTDAYVYYSTSPSLANPKSTGNASSTPSGSVFIHSVTLSGLTIGTPYYFYVKSTDNNGDYSIDTNSGTYYAIPAKRDLVAPVISSITWSVPVSADQAAIVWKTADNNGVAKAATSQVWYGISSGTYPNFTVLDSTLSVYHVVTLASTTVNGAGGTNGLSPRGLYHFVVVSTDASGNTATSSDQTLDTNTIDNAVPVISAITVTPKSTSAIVTFTTNKVATSTAEYSLDGTTWTHVVSSAYGVSQSITFGGLTPNTTYFYQVQASDAIGNTSAYVSGTSATFVTTGGPIITKLADTNLDGTSITINWNTSTSSNAYVYYSRDSALGDAATASVATSTTAHSVTLGGLLASTKYYYYITSTNIDGATIDTNSGLYYSFKTSADLTPPVISAVSVPVTTDDSAVITWKTDKLATSQVEYGTVASTTDGTYQNVTVINSTPTINHIVTLSPGVPTATPAGGTVVLTKSTTYYYRVISVDTTPAANATASAENSFATTAGAVTVVNTTVVGGTATNSSIQAAATNTTTPPVIQSVTTGNVGAFTTDISLTTDNDVIAFIDYGVDTTYGSSAGDHSYSSSKTITLKSLLEGTEYHYRVTVFDKYGNTASSGDQTFKTSFVSETLDNRTTLEKAADVQGKIQQLIESALPSLAPPFITAPTIANITENSADISWTTNIKTNGSVRYATDADYLAKNDYVTEVSTGQDTKLDTVHTTTLSGLTSNTLYHVQVRSYVFPQVVGKSTDLTFSTKASPITPNIVDVKTSGFTVVWQTDDPTSSIVEYRNLKTGESNRFADDTLKTYHNVQLQNLPSGTSYAVMVSGVNKNGNQLSADQSLSVTTGVDIIPPVISNFKVDNALVPGRVGFIQTVVGWQTDKPANSTVYYEEGAGVTAPGKELANKVESLDTFSTSHIMILANLKAGTVYRIKVVSTDQSGNTKTFGPTSIITPQQSQSVLDIIVKNFEDTFKFLGAKQ